MRSGIVELYIGNGKGKTSAAVGTAIRAAGHGYNVIIFQFLKGRESGEQTLLKNIENIEFIKCNNSKKFIMEMDNIEKEILKKEVNYYVRQIKKETIINNYDVIIADEILGCLENKLIGEDKLLDIIDGKSENIELIFTGRNATEKIIEKSDLITEMKKIKHPYDKGIIAREGIEY
ncbi:cob(I)yrinic acid a,c-diamide adenosyltransferase [Haliovirga abyssi]|uniref:Cob(I)alamin adenosyltransferase/cobinamide ATP-dependent adenosyltransferase n=1 Tax=Haliovirga abyssi TaxID=2996794 RepID=A0AAU9DVW5_9FUSO|nr:cob(I)yrinic acid a,c-diamide adenosyltransferase [Haliovirga abyssi]BDU51534.1 cob(I)alamin adenosyltransferase/cobinamide ATP-dependent adenosyltransferase [Haliovirga abyssi]